MSRKRVIILGAAGRDFHNFNTYFRDNGDYEVVAFTAAQIPDIEGRRYPPDLAGGLYPGGIPIEAEEDLPQLIRDLDVDVCVFAYSDVDYVNVMRLGAICNAAGASYLMLGPRDTMVRSSKPLISIGAVRTGVGKSQTSRRVIEILMEYGLKVVAIRHPMPYGDLSAQRVQRFARIEDLAKHRCTIEEMEEYEPHIVRGNVIYAGVDYEAILRAAENDPDGCDIIVWDGGNNDFPFYHSDFHICLVDPHRPGHEISYYPGEITLRMADVAIINKIDTASPQDVQVVRENISMVAPKAMIIEAASPVRVSDRSVIQGKRVLCVEDGPSLTHGGMQLGAAVVAAKKYGAAELIDPRPWLAGSLRDTYEKYPNIGTLLPAMGYGKEQLADLQKTINATECDTVVIGTPIDLSRVIEIEKPHTRVFYDLQSIGYPNLEGVVKAFVEEKMPSEVA